MASNAYPRTRSGVANIVKRKLTEASSEPVAVAKWAKRARSVRGALRTKNLHHAALVAMALDRDTAVSKAAEDTANALSARDAAHAAAMASLDDQHVFNMDRLDNFYEQEMSIMSATNTELSRNNTELSQDNAELECTKDGLVTVYNEFVQKSAREYSFICDQNTDIALRCNKLEDTYNGEYTVKEKYDAERAVLETQCMELSVDCDLLNEQILDMYGQVKEGVERERVAGLEVMQKAATQRGEIQALHVLAGTVKEQVLASRASDIQTIATLRAELESANKRADSETLHTHRSRGGEEMTINNEPLFYGGMNRPPAVDDGHTYKSRMLTVVKQEVKQ
jgi:hypothetical protein